jgi:hypothetical protein
MMEQTGARGHDAGRIRFIALAMIERQKKTIMKGRKK